MNVDVGQKVLILTEPYQGCQGEVIEVGVMKQSDVRDPRDICEGDVLVKVSQSLSVVDGKKCSEVNLAIPISDLSLVI